MAKTETKTDIFRLDFISSLQLLFIALKLIPGTTVYNWSWWWVFSPLIGSVAFVIIVFFGTLLTMWAIGNYK